MGIFLPDSPSVLQFELLTGPQSVISPLMFLGLFAFSDFELE